MKEPKMQGTNRTSTPHPKPKDGTQDVPKKGTDANWFGPSEEPQEEFIENDPVPPSDDADKGKMSEGKPTHGG